MKINRTIFYSVVRMNPFGGKLTQLNVDGTNAILDTWERSPLANGDLECLAYILATAFGETGGMDWRQKEKGGDAYLFRMYDMAGDRPAKARELGNTFPGDGVRYCGRSWPQITGRANYAKFSKLLGIDLVGEPDLALRKDIAASILMVGMTYGVFTGRKLTDYFDGRPHDVAEMRRRRMGARRIINGQDRAESFARVAAAFAQGLQAATKATPAALLDLSALIPGTAPLTGSGASAADAGVALPEGLPAVLGDLPGHVIQAAVREATGGQAAPPVDKGASPFKSLVVGGSVLAGLPGIVSTITSVQDRWIALAIVALIVLGVGLVVTGRVKIANDTGV